MLHILLVEDNPGDQKLFEEAVKEGQIACSLRKASSVKECAGLIDTQKPDLIFMDVIMPGMTGGDFVKILQKDSLLKEIRIIFLTGVMDSNQDSNIGKLNVGGVFFPALSKPVEGQRLRQALQDLNII